MNIAPISKINVLNLISKNKIPLLYSYRNTFIVKRKIEPPIKRKWAERPKILKAKHFIYETVEDTTLTSPPDLHVVLTSFVDGIGNTGDVISVDAFYARENLLLTKKAVYATPENIAKYTSNDKEKKKQAKYSSIHAGMMVKTLSSVTIPVFMNQETPWMVDTNHIHIAFRTEGFHVPAHAIQLPSTPIEGPDSEKEGCDFIVSVTINETEKVSVRCRIFHLKPGLETARISRELYLDRAEPILEEQREILDSLPTPQIFDDPSMSISLVEKYRIQYLK